MSRTTPEAEYRRLVAEEFGDNEFWPTRDVVSHRPSQRADASAGDLEFEVVWICEHGDERSFEPVQYLTHNEHFKAYVRTHGLETVVRAQTRRERARAGRK